MSLMEEILRHDEEFCELIERLETDQEFGKTFHREIEEIKQIRIPLGDIAHRAPVAEINPLIGRLNGKKILCKGNHDKEYANELFGGVYDFLEIAVSGVNVSLMHYPMMEWPKSRRGSLHLHGHIHSKGEYNLQQRESGILRYDVGVDANYFYPVSIEQVKDFFKSKEI